MPIQNGQYNMESTGKDPSLSPVIPTGEPCSVQEDDRIAIFLAVFCKFTRALPLGILSCPVHCQTEGTTAQAPNAMYMPIAPLYLADPMLSRNRILSCKRAVDTPRFRGPSIYHKGPAHTLQKAGNTDNLPCT